MLFKLLVVSTAVLLNSKAARAQGRMTPCQVVSSQSADFITMFPTASAALVEAQPMADCLKSVPVWEDSAALIDEMQYFIEWQSNLAWIKNPPADYTGNKTDVQQKIKNIASNLKNYKDEYTLQQDLNLAIAEAYDFHFVWTPDILNLFRFRRGNIGRGLLDEFAIVSVSEDGKALPKLYNFYDIMTQKGGSLPSPITEINGKSAEDYVQRWSSPFSYHEDHARYNRLFPNQAQISTGSIINQFGRSNTPDGNTTRVKHANGTLFEYINSATIPLNAFDSISDGTDLFNAFCNQGPPKTNEKRDTTEVLRDATKVKKNKREQPTATGFPTPQVLHSEAVLGGYYLSGNGYDDVAVLSVPSFSPETDAGPAEFQDITGSFIQGAAAAGKKRLVIDLRGNGGGRVFLGYDMFKQLFPSIDPYGASQFRANDAFDLVGQFMTEVLKDVSYDDAFKDFQAKGLQSTVGILYQSIFNYKLPNTVENKNFTSWQDFFGPHEINGDKFTSVSRKDLNNFFSDDLTMDVTGFRTRADKLNKKQPFKSENIVLLQDGGCGSTCAVFTEFMKNQGGVDQIVVGGIPRTGPMQGVSGSKGSQVYTWTQVWGEAERAYSNLPRANQAALNNTDLGKLVFTTRPLSRTAYSSSGGSASVINLRDNIREGDKSVTPLNFVYEAADCRLFYTMDMIQDVSAVWKKTVDAKWGDKSKVCVEGSTGHKSASAGKAQLKDGDTTKKTAAATKLGGALTAAVVAAAVAVLMV